MGFDKRRAGENKDGLPRKTNEKKTPKKTQKNDFMKTGGKSHEKNRALETHRTCGMNSGAKCFPKPTKERTQRTKKKNTIHPGENQQSLGRGKNNRPPAKEDKIGKKNKKRRRGAHNQQERRSSTKEVPCPGARGREKTFFNYFHTNIMCRQKKEKTV